MWRLKQNLRRIDLDIEQGSLDHFDVFIQAVRDAATQNDDSKWYYFTAAPQCPQLNGLPYGRCVILLLTMIEIYALTRELNSLLSNTPFDAIFVQFCKSLAYMV